VIRDAFRGTLPAALALLALGGGIVAFVRFALPRADGGEGAFAAALLALAAGAVFGPAAFRRASSRFAPAVHALLRCAAFGAGAAVTVLAAAGAGALVGAFAGFYAFLTGAVAYACGGGPGRVLAPAAALILLGSLFFWDDVFLRDAEDRAQSAARAFDCNAAAAAAVTVGYDWIHSPILYKDNETAESLFDRELGGVGTFTGRTVWLALLAAAAGLWRKPCAAAS